MVGGAQWGTAEISIPRPLERAPSNTSCSQRGSWVGPGKDPKCHTRWKGYGQWRWTKSWQAASTVTCVPAAPQSAGQRGPSSPISEGLAPKRVVHVWGSKYASASPTIPPLNCFKKNINKKYRERRRASLQRFPLCLLQLRTGQVRRVGPPTVQSVWSDLFN